jgi:hypothetical protein
MKWNDVASVTVSAAALSTLAANTIVHQISSITGTLESIPAGVDGRVIVLQNLTASTDLSIVDNTDNIRTGTGTAITLKPNASLLLRYDTSTSKWYILGGAGSGGGLTPSIITGALTAESGRQYFTNHSTSFEIALPSSPNVGDMFEVVDYAGNWNTKPVTLNPANASHSINGAAANENFVLDVLGVWVQVVYVASNNWRIISPIDPALAVSGPTTVLPVSNANYTLSNINDTAIVLYTTGASNRTLTLPLASANLGKTITAKKVDSGIGQVLVTRAGADTIDGDTSFILDYRYEYVELASDGTNWHIVG